MPCYYFTCDDDIIYPPDYVSKTIESIETYIDTTTIHANIPLSETFGYTTALRSLTQGRATHSMEFLKYQELPADQVAQVTNKAGI